MVEMKFSKSHEWVKLEGDIAIIGISNYAQDQLGDIVFVELPKVGDKLEQFAQLGTVESTKAASELYSPLTGEVIEVNNEVINNPQLINESPESSGWMLKLKVKDTSQLNNLLDEVAYKELIAKESH